MTIKLIPHLRLVFTALTCLVVAARTIAAPDGTTRSCDSEKEPIAACVDGTPILLRDVDARAGKRTIRSSGSLEQVMYDTRQAILDAMIAELLVGGEAERKQTTVEALLEARRRDVPPPTPADVEAALSRDRRPLGAPVPPSVRQQAEATLVQEREVNSVRAFVASLRRAATVDVRLAPPREPITIRPDDAALGPSDAPLHLVVFSDYQCPYCAQLAMSIQALRQRVGSDLRIVHKDLPLSIHSEAQRAAEAARCAGAQGRYWEYHDLLFAKRGVLDEGSLLNDAQQLGLDDEAWLSCLRSHTFAEQVHLNAREAREMGLDSTPVSFLNGRRIMGAVDADTLITMAEQELTLYRRAKGRGEAR